MKIRALCLAVAVTGAAFAAGQEAPGAQAASQRAFKLGLRPFYMPGYEPARALHLALWDSPMSRLELAVSREQWTARNPVPAGGVVPFQASPLPFRLRFDSAGRLVLGPWSSKWDQLTWQEKVATGVQTTYLVCVVLQIVGHAH